jgi:F-type H+-transporting ATPase subunit delta
MDFRPSNKKAMPQGKSKPREASVADQRVAAVYSRALLGATEPAGVTDQVVEDFDAFISEVVDPHPYFEAILASALVSADQKAATLDRLLKKHVHPLLLNFLKVLARHTRLNLLRAVHKAVHAAHDAMRGRIPVEIRSGGPLSPAAVQFISDRLRQSLGGEPKLTVTEQPDLIAGVVLRIGDTIYDGSVATQLRALRDEMIDRSVHEIQSR